MLKKLIGPILGLAFWGNAGAVSITSDFTGAWFNPATDGQGFIIQVLFNERLGAYWFTMDNAGDQLYGLGVGEIDGDEATVDLLSPSGASFSAFDPADVQLQALATVTFEFDSCTTGLASWVSTNPEIGSGSMPIQRITENADASCSGGVSDNTRQSDDPLDFRVFLSNLGVEPLGKAKADYDRSATRTDFSVELEDVTPGSYNLLVDGVPRGVIEVVAVVGGTEGEIEFSSPQDAGEMLLDFEPLDLLVQIEQDGTILFEGTLSAGSGNGGTENPEDEVGTEEPEDETGTENPEDEISDDDSAPEFGDTEIKVDLVSTGADADASGDAELESRPDRVEFKVEAEDLAVGTYEVWVGDTKRADMEVVMTPEGTEGEVEFRNPVEPGKLLLDFDPSGQSVSVRQGSTVYLQADFPS